MTRTSRRLISIAGVAIVLLVLANESIWLHVLGLVGSRAGLWGTFQLDNTELQMQGNWYAIAKSSDYKGKGTPLPGLLAFRSDWPRFGPTNQIGVIKVTGEDASKLAAPGPHVQREEKYSWGTAVYLRTGNAVFIPEARLLVTSGAGFEGRLAEAVLDIQAVTARSDVLKK